MDNASLPELAQHAELVRDRVRHVAADIRALLSEDLPRFVERELKRGFVENPEFAARLSDERLAELKAECIAEGERGRDRVLMSLEDEALWFPATLPPVENRATIASNTALWAAVSGIAESVHALRQRFGYPTLPAGDVSVEYRPPTWFIGRRYLPTLTEKYWRLLAELEELHSRAGAIRKESSKAELTRRWEGP